MDFKKKTHSKLYFWLAFLVMLSGGLIIIFLFYQTELCLEPRDVHKQTTTVNPNWLSYTNEMYKYDFKYPPEAKISEAKPDRFFLNEENKKGGLTTGEIYKNYTGKVCLELIYVLGYIYFSAPANKNFNLVNCGRTTAGYKIMEKHEDVTIQGKKYTATGFEELGPGQTLNYHNETMVIFLENGMRIEYGSTADSGSTYNDYLKMKTVLQNIIETFRKNVISF